MTKALVLTGTAPYSFGESLVIECAANRPDAIIIAVDRLRNQTLSGLSNVREIIIDLDPVSGNSSSALSALSDHVYGELCELADRESISAIDCVCFSAGVYEYGRFLDMPVSQRTRLYGLNIVGKAEALHAILKLNASRGFDNSNGLTVGDIGSLHGFRLSTLRTLYSASKAFGVDFLHALQNGNEIRRGVNILPGPIDTHMLHRNHWTSKANGPLTFFEAIREGSREEYEAVFVRCDKEVLLQVASRFGYNELETLAYFDEYSKYRRQVNDGPDGILSVNVAASFAQQALRHGSLNDNIYVLTAPKGKTTVRAHSYLDCARAGFCVGGDEWPPN